MITSVIPFAVILLPLYVAAVWYGHRRRPKPLWRHALQAGLILYILLLVELTLMPIPIQPSLIAEQKARSMIHVNLIPLVETYRSLQSPLPGVSLRHIVGNALLLAPLGFLLPWWGQRHSTLLTSALIGLAASAAIEGSQLLLSLTLGGFRIVDVDDLILNTLSAVIGYCAAILLQLLFKRIGSHEQSV